MVGTSAPGRRGSFDAGCLVPRPLSDLLFFAPKQRTRCAARRVRDGESLWIEAANATRCD